MKYSQLITLFNSVVTTAYPSLVLVEENKIPPSNVAKWVRSSFIPAPSSVNIEAAQAGIHEYVGIHQFDIFNKLGTGIDAVTAEDIIELFEKQVFNTQDYQVFITSAFILPADFINTQANSTSYITPVQIRWKTYN